MTVQLFLKVLKSDEASEFNGLNPTFIYSV